MKPWFPLCVLVLAAFVSLFAGSREFSLHVLKAKTADGEVAAVRWHQGKDDGPVFGFHLDEGKVFNDEILGKCSETTEMRTHNDFSYPVVRVSCSDVVMTVSGVDFGER